MLWGRNRGKGRQPLGVKPRTPLTWAASALPLSHDNRRTTNPHKPLYYCIFTSWHLISFIFSMRQDALSMPMHIWGYKLCVVLHQSLLRGSFVNTDETNAVCIVRYTVFTVTWCRQLFALRASSHCKQDVGTLLWLHVETLKRVSIPLFVRLERCFAHGCFFVRL